GGGDPRGARHDHPPTGRLPDQPAAGVLTAGPPKRVGLMAKLERLTAEQERALVAFHQEWLAVGLSTAPADRARAEAAIAEMYGLVGEQPPRFLWVDSPATAILGIHLLKELRNQK